MNIEAIEAAAAAEAKRVMEEENRLAARAAERKARRTARALRRQGGSAHGACALLALMGDDAAARHVESAKDWLSTQAARLQLDALEQKNVAFAERIAALLRADATKKLEVMAACAAFGDSALDYKRYLEGKDRE